MATRKVTSIYKMQRIPETKDIYSLEKSQFMYKYNNSQ